MTASGMDESEEVSDVGAWLQTYLRDQGGESLRADVMEAYAQASGDHGREVADRMGKQRAKVIGLRSVK